MKKTIKIRLSKRKKKLIAGQRKALSLVPKVRSVVEVRFLDDGRSFPYYNDQFDLNVGDAVFVSGELAGKIGIVESVNTKFKVDLSYYQKVVARTEFHLSGTYIPICGMLVSRSASAKPNASMFRNWVKPRIPYTSSGDIVYGEGYSFVLDRFENDSDVDPTILSRGLSYCTEGRIRYISLRNGVGTAFVIGTQCYEVNFRYRDGLIQDMYCDCPYPKLCKHNLAVLTVLRNILDTFDSADKPDFIAIERRFFGEMLSISKQSITI